MVVVLYVWGGRWRGGEREGVEGQRLVVVWYMCGRGVGGGGGR